MSFVLSLKEIKNGEKVGSVYVKGDYYKQGKNLLIFKGETYPSNMTNEELFSHVSREGIHIVKKMKGDFFIIYYDDASKNIYVADDRLGMESLFYFYDKEKIIFSDDFWEIINIIEPDASDIDIQSIKELILFSYPLFYKTVVKNLEIFPPASVGEFSLEDGIFKVTNYWDFKYNPNENLSIDEAAERLDYFLDNAMKQIKEKNSLETTYGFGLSGGLDSRLIPYYGLKHNMNLKSFIIGEKRAHILLSRDHSSARKLAKHFNLHHSEMEYDSESFENKNFYDVRYFPNGPAQCFIAIHDRLPKFDVLLMGIGGTEILGSPLIPDNIMKLSEEELLDYIITKWSCVKGAKSSGMIMNENELMKAKSKIRQFIRENSSKSNLDIFQKYLFFNFISKNKYIGFGGLDRKRKIYSIFLNPYLFEEALTWRPEFLMNRRLQNNLYIKKFPELSKIKAQDDKVAIFYRNKRFYNLRKIFAKIALIIRGGGMRGREWARKTKYRKYSHGILLKPNSIFNSIFDIKKIIKLRKKEDMHIYVDLVKIKLILDLIETKGYKDFFK